jgi:DNA polymerase-3 subunit alpha
LEEWLQNHSEKQPVLYIKVSLELQDENLLLRINQLLKRNKGNVQVVLHYEKNRKTIRLGHDYRMNPDPNVLNELRNILGSKNVVLKD